MLILSWISHMPLIFNSVHFSCNKSFNGVKVQKMNEHRIIFSHVCLQHPSCYRFSTTFFFFYILLVNYQYHRKCFTVISPDQNHNETQQQNSFLYQFFQLVSCYHNFSAIFNVIKLNTVWILVLCNIFFSPRN